MKQESQVDEMCERLRKLCAEDAEERLLRNLLHQIENPLKPRNESGRFRVSPALLLLAAFAAIAAGAFLYFSFGRV